MLTGPQQKRPIPLIYLNFENFAYGLKRLSQRLKQGWPTPHAAQKGISAAQSWIETRWFFDILSVFPQFLSKIGPKSQYFWKFFRMRPRDRFGLATPGLKLSQKFPYKKYNSKSLTRAYIRLTKNESFFNVTLLEFLLIRVHLFGILEYNQR
jgi:hypothetical protein